MKKVLMLISAIILYSQISYPQGITFKHFEADSKNGLSHNSIYDIVQDDIGFLYLATENGVDKFDGTNFENLSLKYPGCKPSKIISSLAYDNKISRIIIGTHTGNLFYFSLLNEKFYCINFNPKNKHNDLRINKILSLNDKIYIATNYGLWILKDGKSSYFNLPSINDIKEHNNFIYLATDNQIYKLNPSTSALSKLKIPINTKINVLETIDQKLIIGTNQGIYTYNLKTNLLEASPILTQYIITALAIDSHKNIWAGTRYSGLFLITDNQIFNFKHDYKDKYSLSSNYILSIFVDKDDNIWIGTYLGGLNKITKNSILLLNIRKNLKNISQEFIEAIYEDSKGNLWFGTTKGELSIWDRKNNKIYTYKLSEKIHIKTIFQDSKGRIWIGTDGAGLILYNPNQNKIEKIFIKSQQDSNSINCNRIWSIVEDEENNIWIGTFGGGLNLFLEKEMKFIKFTHNPDNPNSIVCNYITKLFIDSQNRLWIGTICGLDLFNKISKSFVHFLNQDNIPPDRKWINNIMQTSDGKLWIATKYGIGVIDITNTQVSFVDTDKIIQSVLNIIEDHKQRLWLVTDNQLIMYDPKQGIFKKFDADNGLINTQFTSKAATKTKDGWLIVGGTKGINIFSPETLELTTEKPKPYLKSIYIGDEELYFDTVTKYKKFIKIKKNRKFPLKLEFGSVNFGSDEVKIKYKLEGYDTTWRDLEDSLPYYNNLQSKMYRLIIKAVNKNGEESDAVVVNIMVSPNLSDSWIYRHSWIFILLLIALLALRRFIRTHKEKIKLEQKVKEQTQELILKNKQLSDQNKLLQEKHQELEKAYQELKDKTQKIQKQSEELQKQSQLLRQKNEEIEASFRYARRIQNAMLPKHEYLKNIFKEFFILFRPRDIVSGDFYWAYAYTENNKKTAIAVVGDCTGHGVPGAFMSILTISLLNKIVREHKVTEPNLILNQLRKEIINALVHDNEEEKPYDGVDLTLIKIIDNKILIFAAANHVAYFIKNSENQLIELKGNRMPIGFYFNMTDFEQRELIVNEGDIIYMFTDGFPDQFGGKDGKKFKYSRFKALIQQISKLPMEIQKQELEKTFENWINYKEEDGKIKVYEQIDDVLIFAIKF